LGTGVVHNLEFERFVSEKKVVITTVVGAICLINKRP